MSDLTVEQQLKQIAALQTPVTNVYRRVIPAAVGGVAGETVIDSPGHYFYVKESNETCLYQMDDGREQPFDIGTGPNTRGLGMFRKLTIKNIFAVPVTVEIVVGLGEFTDNRFTLVPSRDFALPVYEANTVMTGWAFNSLAANEEVTFDGIPILPIVLRKQITVSNLHQTNAIYVLDSNGNDACAVFPLSSIALPVSNAVRVKNKTAGVIPVCISEIWYKRIS